MDDGYRDFYLYAYPVFKSFGYPATVFITSDFIDRRIFFWWDTIDYAINSTRLDAIDLSFMNLGTISLTEQNQKSLVSGKITKYCKKLPNEEKLKLINNLVGNLGVDISNQPSGKFEPTAWSEIIEMQKNNIEFHPHTKTHPIVALISAAQKQTEIGEPKKLIESKLGNRANIFCYPNGQWEDFDEETIDILKANGYIAAVTGMEGFDNTKAKTDLFRLRRYPIPPNIVMFKRYVSGLEKFTRLVLRRNY